MRKYLAALHEKSDHHKKRFAFLTAGIFTLIVFTFWSLAMFGNGGTLAQKNEPAAGTARELGPLASLRAGLSSGLSGFTDALLSFKNNVQEVIGSDTDKVKLQQDITNIYGR